MTRDRGWRRSQAARHVRRWRNIILNVWGERPSRRTRYLIFGSELHADFDRYVDELAKVRSVTRMPCSCYMCGNPRRHIGEPSVQEKRAEGAE